MKKNHKIVPVLKHHSMKIIWDGGRTGNVEIIKFSRVRQWVCRSCNMVNQLVPEYVSNIR
jgi:hypothetical protein